MQIDRFEEGLVVKSQSFMKSSSLKYIKISAIGPGFGGGSTTISEDIVPTMASVSKKHSAPVTNKSIVTDEFSTKIAKTLPPFVRHFKATNASDAAIFKVEDSKDWKGETWYFCDFTNHLNHIKCHPNPDPDCCTCQKWLKEKDGAPAAEIVDDQGLAITDLTDDTDSTNSSDMYYLLTSTMSIASDNKEVIYYIADSLNTIHDL